MCGIFGSINFNFNSEIVRKELIHRGPDAQEIVEFDNVKLFHFRLAIQDLSTDANQPMEYGQYVIIYNGEIYNHIELRNQFNLTCKTNSDTETILHLYSILGERMLDYFDGMFSIAIYDKKNFKLFIARDRAGKKPLFYYHNNSSFVFSSELNAIASIVNLTIDDQSICGYLKTGVFTFDSTPYKNVSKLEPGSFICIDTKSLDVKVKKWWDITNYYFQPKIKSLTEGEELVNYHLHNSIKRRINSSDLEVGSFLSGGIDSGLVTSIASKYKDNLKTFTIEFDGAYNEAPLARKVAEKYATNHTSIKISFDGLTSDIESIISNYGQPFSDSSSIPSYYVSKEAKKYLTVILNGDGADELFGGYRRFVPYSKFNLFSNTEVISLMSRSLLKCLPFPKNKKSNYNYIYRLIDLLSKENVERYLSSTTDIFVGYENEALRRCEMSKLKDTYMQYSSYKMSSLDKLMLMDFNSLFDNLLMKMDIATMANSLEGRSPFLSKELLEIAPTLDGSLKINGTNTKYVLRNLSQKYLPFELVNQPKRGFEIPLNSWINTVLKEMVSDKLLSHSSYSKNLLGVEFIDKLINSSANMASEKRAKVLFSLLSLEIWYENFKNKQLHVH